MKLKNIFRRKKPVADLQQRMFTAAQHNRLIDWPVSYQRINGDLFEEYQTIILRCRNLAQNNENVIGLLRNLQRNVIGQTGFTLQSKADDLEIRPEIERAWRDYCSRAAHAVTFDERSSARDLDILILRSLMIDGEAYIHRVKDNSSRYGWRYEVIDALQIDPFYINDTLPGGGRIFMGVELDARGREVAYWYRPVVCERYNTGPRTRIPAQNIIHLFRKEFPSQIRGIPPLVGAVLNLKQLDDYKNAELIHAQIASCTMGVWEWNGQNNEDVITDRQADDHGEFVREIKPGIFPIAPRGYTAKFLQNSAPNSQFPSFVKSILRSICNSVGLSYNKGSGDYESVNYSSLREASLEDRETYGELQKFMIENWKDLQFADFISACIESRIIRANSFASVLKHQFFGRRFSWVDPQKEISAKKEELSLMLTDPISELEARGEDPEELLQKLVAWRDLLRKYGLEAFWDSAFDKLPGTLEMTETPPEDNNND